MHQEPPITIDELAAGDDKDKAAFFVGREDIIAGIESTVAGIESRIETEISDIGLQPCQTIASQKTWLIKGHQVLANQLCSLICRTDGRQGKTALWWWRSNRRT